MEEFKVIAPTRVDLAGGTLDLWPLYCLVERALTINMAIELSMVVSFSVQKDCPFKMEILAQNGESFSFSKPPDREGTGQLGLALRFPVSVVSRYLRQKEELPRFHIRIGLSSDVPMGSGLGGSSAMCVALVRGLARVFNDFQAQGWQWKMLEWVKDMEASFLKTPTGTQDYLATLFGGLNCFDFRIGSVERVPYVKGVFEEVSKRALVLFSGQSHQSGMSNWELFKGALSGGNDVIRGLEGISDVSLELDGELRSGNLNWKYIGQCLNNEWKVRRDLFRVQTDRLEEIVSFLGHQKNVYGVKVCGAAHGGSLLALVNPDHRQEIAESCRLHGIQVLSSLGTVQGVHIV